MNKEPYSDEEMTRLLYKVIIGLFVIIAVLVVIGVILSPTWASAFAWIIWPATVVTLVTIGSLIYLRYLG